METDELKSAPDFVEVLNALRNEQLTFGENANIIESKLNLFKFGKNEEEPDKVSHTPQDILSEFWIIIDILKKHNNSLKRSVTQLTNLVG